MRYEEIRVPGEGPVVVGVDGSATSLAAVELGADEAAWRHAPLELVHVATRAGADEVLDVATRRAHAGHPELEVRTWSGPGAVTGVLSDHAGGGLLVVGHRGHGPRRSTAGSVALRLVDTGPGVVVVFRPTLEPGGPGPVLLGIDPSTALESLDGLFGFGCHEAHLRGTSLRIMSVPGGFATTGPGLPVGLADAVRPWAEKYPDVDVQLTARPGLDPAIALAAATHGAQLAIVAAAGPGGAASIAHALVQRAACPVAVARR